MFHLMVFESLEFPFPYIAGENFLLAFRSNFRLVLIYFIRNYYNWKLQHRCSNFTFQFMSIFYWKILIIIDRATVNQMNKNSWLRLCCVISQIGNFFWQSCCYVMIYTHVIKYETYKTSNDRKDINWNKAFCLP